MSDGICRDYFESAESCTISKKRALLELKRHNCCTEEDIAEFYGELSERDIYRAQEVLRWLGY